MLPRLMGAVVGLAVAGMVTAAQAATVTLQYTGDPYTNISGDYTTDMYISGWVELPFAPFVDDGTIYTKQPGATTSPYDVVDFSFTDGIDTYTRLTTGQYGFKFLTDATGAIVGWRIDLDNTLRSCFNPPPIGSSNSFCPGDYTAGATVFNVTNPGEWTVVPLPAALPLFATAIAGMGLLGWRRKRKAAV